MIEAHTLVETEYNLEKVPHTSSSINSTEIKSKVSIDSKRETTISKEVVKHIKGIKTIRKVAEQNENIYSKRYQQYNDNTHG